MVKKVHHKGNLLTKELRRLLWAGGIGVNGIKEVYKSEMAFRSEIFYGLILIPLAIFLPIGILPKVFLLESMFLVFIAELINSCCEAVVDYISEDHHPKARKVKDMGCSIVFLTLLNAGAMWIWAIFDMLS